MANPVITKIESILAAAKADASVAVAYLKHAPLVRILIAVVGLAAIVAIAKSGYDSAIVTIAYNYGVILLVGTIVIEALIVIGNAYIEGKRIQYLQKDDGSPGPLGGGIQQAVEAAGTSLVDKGAPKT